MSLNPFELNSLSRKFKPGKNLGFDEAFLDTHNKEQDVLDDERDHVNYKILSIIVLIGLTILAGRVFFLQGIQGRHYRALAEGNKLRIQYTLAPRGILEDRMGKIIAANTPSFELVVVPADLSKDPALFSLRLNIVGQILGRTYDELVEIIKAMDPKSYQAQTLVQDITKDQALILLAKQDELKAFMVQNNPIRDYKDPLVFSHLVGYTGKITEQELSDHKDQDYILNDYIGKSGVEYEYEKYLRGLAGQRQTEIDAQGNFKKTLAELPATAGQNVRLNIDYDLQKKIYDSLKTIMGRGHAQRAAAVATNPQTGEVLASISLPSFDNNMFARGISRDEYNKLLNDSNTPLLNRPLSGTYPPGSTIKPMMAVAALSEGIVTPTTKILDDGVIRVGAYTFYGYERTGLGVMDIYSAIARSSDIYFYTVGGGNARGPIKEGLGPDRIASYLRKFYLGQTLGIDLPSERPGLVPDSAWKKAAKNEPWYLGDTYHYSIGQGDLLTTPLQVNSWTATIANGGRVLRPYVLNQVLDKTGKLIAAGAPKVLAENLFDPKIIQVVQDGMRQTVTTGSARALNSLPIEISGKTGTAQFDARDLQRTHAWFTSYAPSNDPQIALTILIESGGEGSSVAVPVAREVYQWWGQNRYNK